MDKYILQSNEVLLYEREVYVEKIKKAKVNLILTNLYIVLEITRKLGFRKYETVTEQFLLEDIKFYNEKPQIIQKKETVKIYFKTQELEIVFESSLVASKFSNKAMEAVTGKSITTRGANRVKKAISLVDDTLGINITGTVANVLENGISKSLFKGIGKRSELKAKKNNSSETVSTVANAATIVAKRVIETRSNSTDFSMEQNIEQVKKLKELLDIGAISKEEFETKKKELLGL